MSTKTAKKPFANPLELLREAGQNAPKAVKRELIDPFPDEILRQILGRAPKMERKFSGEILPGSTMEMKKVVTGEAQENEKLRKMVYLERKMREENTILVERRTAELRLQIKAIHEEVEKVARITPQLAEEVKIAAFQAPSSTSIYELYFLERIFEFIKSFRKKIENANVWLASVNKRAMKKNRWGANYKKHGAKYLLSSEHYLQRSAG